jgi:hypothetical protein
MGGAALKSLATAQGMNLSRLGGAVFALALGCGGDPENTPEGGATAPAASTNEPADPSPEGGPRFTLDGRGSSTKTSSVVEVVEGEQVALTITGTDPADNLLVLRALFAGVESVVGDHRWPLGLPEVAEVFAVGTVDGQLYHTVGGELEVSLSADHRNEGRFELELAPRAESSAPVGTPSVGEPSVAGAELTLSGSFESEWTVTCYSLVNGFTGGHTSSNSPYCNALTL